MKTFLGAILVLDVYLVVYYRLMVRYHYERQYKIKESTFWVIFSFAPYQRLDQRGKHFARRHIAAVLLMVAIVVSLAAFSDLQVSASLSNAANSLD